MRFSPPYHCDDCSRQSPVAVSCPSCAGPMRDAHGFAPPSPRRFEESLLPGRGHRAAAVLAMTAWNIALLVCLFGLTARGARMAAMSLGGPLPWFAALAALAPLPLLAGALARRARARRRAAWEREQEQRLRARAREASGVDKIAQAEDEALTRFAGRVRLLESVEGACGLAALHEPDDARAAGVFLVQDESGAALFDDDCFELFGASGDVDAPLSLRAGDEVEVIGRGRWSPASGAVDGGGYRGAKVLRLEVTPEAPLLLRRVL